MSQAFNNGLYRFCRFWIRQTFRLMFRIEAHGLENIPAEGGCLLVSNHASFLDPPALGCRVTHRYFDYLAKRELFEVPLFGSLIRAVRAHPIRRGGVDRKSLRECASVLKQGGMLVLFPEGTRTRDGRLQEPKAGVAMIAAQADVPFVPAYVQGTFHVWPRHRKLPRPGKVRVFYGEPSELPQRREGMSSKDYYALCSEAMMEGIRALKDRAEAQS